MRPSGGSIEFSRGPITPDLAVRWIHGRPASRADRDPPLQVHAVDAHTFILRESKAVSHEAPFLYLLFGNARALLLDTGATADARRFPVRKTIDAIVAGWLTENPRTLYELVVAHSHGHADHIAGDGQFADRPDSTIVPADVESIRSSFGISSWPGQIKPFDLGGRILEVTGCPGHQEASIALFDPRTGFLMSGDIVYPGRLYVDDIDAFMASLDRLVRLAEDRQVTYVMGAHIEMKRQPGHDFPLGSLYQPDERPLQMTVDQLRAIRDAARSTSANRGIHVFNDFIIFNRPRIWSLVPFIGGALRHRLGRRLSSLTSRS
jgi:hydroxyacylglutathione hydrolase